MVWILPIKISLLCLLPALIIASLDSSETSAASTHSYASLSSQNRSRSLLQVQDVLQHLQYEHSKGNRHPTFTLAIGNPERIEVNVVQSQEAILPKTTYSIHDRTPREVGHLGYFHLVSADGDFVLLTVNRANGEVRGVVKQSDTDWVVVNGEDGLVDSVQDRNLIASVNSGVDEMVHDEKVRNLPATKKAPVSFQPGRYLQTFHSYLNQINLYLDIDYEFVKNNGGSLCNVFSYINSLITAANAVFEREIMTHLNVRYIRQTDFYEDVNSTVDALDKMTMEFGGAEWDEMGVGLHYALLGKKLNGEIGDRSGIGFIKNSLCDSTKGFGVLSGLEGGFDSLDERLGTDLKRFMYAIGHNLGSGTVVDGELESLLFTYGGYWSRLSDVNDIRSWIDNPHLDLSTNPRQVSYDMFESVNGRSDSCLEVPLSSNVEDDLIVGECLSGISSKRIDSGVLSFESSSKTFVRAKTSKPTLFPSLSPTSQSSSYVPSSTVSPTKRSKGGKDPKGSKNGNEGVLSFEARNSSKAIVQARTPREAIEPPTDIPTFSPTYTPSFSPTVSPTKRSKGGKNSKDSKNSKNSDDSKSTKTAKVMAFGRDFRAASDVEIAAASTSEDDRSKRIDSGVLSFESSSKTFVRAKTSKATSSPSLSPTYNTYFPTSQSSSDAPSFPPTESPTKRSKGGKDPKGSKNGNASNDDDSKPTKTAKVMAFGRDFRAASDVETAAPPSDPPTYIPSYMPTNVPTASPIQNKSGKAAPIEGSGLKDGQGSKSTKPSDANNSESGKIGDTADKDNQDDNGLGKAAKVMAVDIEVAAAPDLSPSYFPTHIPSYIPTAFGVVDNGSPTFVPTVGGKASKVDNGLNNDQVSKSTKTSEANNVGSKSMKPSNDNHSKSGKQDINEGKDNQDDKELGKAAKIMAVYRDFRAADTVEVAAAPDLPTLFPSYFPTRIPTAFRVAGNGSPTFVPTVSGKASKVDNGLNNDQGSKSTKTSEAKNKVSKSMKPSD